jgi:hypothetical protein
MDNMVKKMPLSTCTAVTKLMINKNRGGILVSSSYTTPKISSPTSITSPLRKRMTIKTNMPTDINALILLLFYQYLKN